MANACEKALPTACTRTRPARFSFNCMKLFITLILLHSILLTVYFAIDYTKSTRTSIDLAICPTSQKQNKSQLLVIMLDGARWDYLDLLPDADLGGFKMLQEQGVRAEYVEPVTPACSFSNWRTLSTGLFADSHHVLGNRVLDPASGLQISLWSSAAEVEANAPWWQDVEPIWVTATRQGKCVATIGWERSDVPVRGVLPLAAEGYPGRFPTDFSARLTRAEQYLKSGFDLILLHFDELDVQGHIHGPASPEVMKPLREVGTRLQSFLSSAGRSPRINVMVVADHGMTRACNNPPLDLWKHISKTDTQWVSWEPGFVGIYTRAGRAEAVHRLLQATPGWQALLKTDVPDVLHVKRSRLAPDVLLLARPWRCDGGDRMWARGNHGLYPAFMADMRGVFLAKGVAFVGGGKVFPPIQMVDVYQIYCHILEIEPQANNGSWEAVADMLLSKKISNVKS